MWGKLLLPLVKKFIPGLSSPYVLVGAFVAGGAAGAWTGVRIVKGGEVRALESTIKDMRATYQSNARIEKEKADKAIARAGERVTVQEVIRDVKDDAVCDLPPVTAGVLDQRLQGRPLGTPGSTADPPRLAGISQGQSLNALDHAAEEYYTCRDEIIAANEKYQGCELICR